MRPLRKAVFQGNTEDVARGLIGCFLCREAAEGLVAGIIVETEAYLSAKDPACHASRGKTARNAAMFGPAGTAYVYFIYGNYYCFNVVTGPEGKGEAVLIRALEPVEGLELMARRRGCGCCDHDLTNGPGKLCQAFAIDRSLDGHDLTERPLYLVANRRQKDYGPVMITGRIGISRGQELPLRFIAGGSNYLSRRAVFD